MGAGWAVVAALALAAGLAAAKPDSVAGSIIELWPLVKTPLPPGLKAVQLDPKSAALLILDIEKATTANGRRPRAVAVAPALGKLLAQARRAGMHVLHSTVPGAASDDILSEVKPLPGEPVVASSVDKFYNTDIEKLLRARGVAKVLIVGTAAEGAVLHTSISAAMRGFDVVVPVDGMPSSSLYAEQYTAWHLQNSPGAWRRVTLTRLDMIRFAQ